MEESVRGHVQRFIQTLLEEEDATALIWKLLQVAEATFRKLKGTELSPAGYAGAQHENGKERRLPPQQRLAA